MYMKPLIVALVYTWSQDHADTLVNFYFLQIKASYVPLLLLLVDLIMIGQHSMLISGTGYVAGHLYLFLDVLYPKAFGVLGLYQRPSSSPGCSHLVLLRLKPVGLTLPTNRLRNLETPVVLLAAVDKARVLEAALALAGFHFRPDLSKAKARDLVVKFV